jgi:nucleoid DNA-binding protein
MKDTLEKGEKIKISGFGNFVVVRRGRGSGATRRQARKSRSRRARY